MPSMLMRYTMYRGKRPEDDPLPGGIRQHTRHVLRPPAELVEAFLKGDGSLTWEEFRERYWQNLKQRFSEDPTLFEELARLAANEDVFLGCSCPTKRNPDVNHCHTVLALTFTQERFPHLPVYFPA